MNKLLVITVLVALLALNAESFRVSRQVEEEEEGTLTKMSNTFWSYYANAVNSAKGYYESIRGLKLEEKAKNVYNDVTTVVSTYTGVIQDQIYHSFYPQSLD